MPNIWLRLIQTRNNTPNRGRPLLIIIDVCSCCCICFEFNRKTLYSHVRNIWIKFNRIDMKLMSKMTRFFKYVIYIQRCFFLIKVMDNPNNFTHQYYYLINLSLKYRLNKIVICTRNMQIYHYRLLYEICIFAQAPLFLKHPEQNETHTWF